MSKETSRRLDRMELICSSTLEKSSLSTPGRYIFNVTEVEGLEVNFSFCLVGLVQDEHKNKTAVSTAQKEKNLLKTAPIIATHFLEN